MTKALKRRDFLKVAGSAAVTAVLAQGVSVRGQSATIGTLTDTSAISADALRGAELAIEMLNGGSATDFFPRGVRLSLGSGGIGTLGLSPDSALVADKRGDTMFIDAASTAPFLTHNGPATYFRVPAHEGMGLVALFQLLFDFDVKEKDYLYVVNERPGIAEDLDNVRAVLDAFNVGFTVNSMTADVGAPTIVAQNPEVVLFSSNVTPAFMAETIRSFSALPEADQPAYGVGDPYLTSFYELQSLLSEQERIGKRWIFFNLQYLAPQSGDAPSNIQSVFDAYKTKFNVEMSAAAVLGFTGVQAWAFVVANGGNLSAANAVAIQDTVNVAWNGVEFAEFEEFGDLRQNISAAAITARVNAEGKFEVAGGGISPLNRNIFIQIGNILCGNLICGSF